MKKLPYSKPVSKRVEELKKGSTGINEAARIILDVSRDEYAFCAYVHYRQADPRQQRRGFCCDKKDEVAQFVGISRQALYKMIDRMEALGLIIAEGNGDLSATAHFIDTENKCQLSLQAKISGVNLVDTDCKLSLHENPKSVNLVAVNKEVLDREKKKEEERDNAGEKNADVAESETSALVRIEVPVRDPNDPREHLEAVLKNLKAEYDWPGTSEKRRPKIVEQGRTVKAGIDLENSVDTVLTALSVKGNFPRGLKLKSPENRRPVRKRIETDNLEDVLLVVSSKCKEWADTEFRKNLNPDTLMNGKFEKYLIAALMDKKGAPSASKTQPQAQAVYAPPTKFFNE